MNQFEVFVGIFLAFTLVFLGSLYIKYNKKCDKCATKTKKNNNTKSVIVSEKNNSNNSNTSSLNSNTISIHKFEELLNQMSNDEVVINQSFNVSCNIIKNLPKNIAKKLLTETQLKLYGLYKQSTVGNINITKPNQLYYAEYAKWEQWNKQKNKNQNITKKEYFYTVYNDIIKKYDLQVVIFRDNINNIDNKSSSYSSSAMKKTISKIEDDSNVSLHGDPHELFNKFDLNNDNNIDIDIDTIKSYILENKININSQNENGTTFLNFACDNNKYKICELLINEFNANVNLCDDMGYTPLHSAAMNENQKIIKLLLDNGANKNAKSYDDNETPHDIADSDDIKKLLTCS